MYDMITGEKVDKNSQTPARHTNGCGKWYDIRRTHFVEIESCFCIRRQARIHVVFFCSLGFPTSSRKQTIGKSLFECEIYAAVVGNVCAFLRMNTAYAYCSLLQNILALVHSATIHAELRQFRSYGSIWCPNIPSLNSRTLCQN